MPLHLQSSEISAVCTAIKVQDDDGKVIGGGGQMLHKDTMFLKSFLAALTFSLPVMSAAAAEPHYRVSLVGDGYENGVWHTGIQIELDDGWKTYWRMPGEAGIPPEFTWKTSVPAHIEVLYPTPARYVDASGEAIGYKHGVLLPVKIDATGASEVTVDLSLFFAVCKDICIPAQATTSITLGSAVKDPANAARVEAALAEVPKPGDLVSSATIAEENGKLQLDLALKEPIDDIFVESPTSAYFAAPVFSNDGLKASLAIANIKEAAKLKGTSLTLTYLKNGKGLEQALTLP